MYRLGIDIGGTKVNFGLLDEKKNLCWKQSMLTPHKLGEEAVGEICRQINAKLQEERIKKEEIAVCGVGVPGTVSRDGTRALLVPNLGWNDIPIAQLFEENLGFSVSAIQDSRAAAYGEYCCGAAQGKQTILCITLGTGIGTGIVMDGKVFHGALGSAGEIGHTPLIRDGRACGCGKKGCLEKYVAGLGLDFSAKELWGEKSTAKDLFNRAKEGSSEAKTILDEAVSNLGAALVGAVNLLSPDCLLFSGGLSSQRQLFVDPLIDYIKKYCYFSHQEADFHIGYAALGEDAPMIGAALAAQVKAKKEVKLSASIMCADFLKLASQLQEMERAGIQYIHFDVMDGHFVPNLMLPMDMIQAVRKGTKLPFDIHLMTERPENIIEKLKLQPGDLVSVHWESTPHVQRAIGMIKAAGAGAILALNPATPIEVVRDCLPDLDGVLIMTVNPGFSGQSMVRQSLDKINRMRTYLDQQGYEQLDLEVDGNCSFGKAPKMRSCGANVFVVGTSSVFLPGLSIEEGTRRLLDCIEKN